MVTPTDARTLIERARDDPAFFWDCLLYTSDAADE